MTIRQTVPSFAAITFALLLTSSSAYSAVEPAGTLSRKAAAATQDSGVYTIKEAGLQFEVPKDWKVSKADDGTVTLTIDEGAISVTMIVDDAYAAVVEGLRRGLKDKLTEVKQKGETKEDTHNGMVHIESTGTGSMQDVPIIWSIDVLKAAKAVTFLTFGIQKSMVAHGEEYEKFVTSIKKI